MVIETGVGVVLHFREILKLESTEVVEIAIVRVLELQGAEANVVECLVVNAEGLVGVLDQLVHRECGIVGLDHSVGDL
jgi:hypothetical protein